MMKGIVCFVCLNMGQKADPIGLRLGIVRGWDAQWFANKKQYGAFLAQDLMIRQCLNKHLNMAGVARVVVERPQKKPHVTVYAARPGVVIGKKGAGMEQLVAKLKKEVGVECVFNIVEVRKPELQARVMAMDIAQQIEKRAFYKRAMRKVIQLAMKAGAKGVKVQCSGRLGGVEIARTEQYLEGRLPLHSLRADIDFSHATAFTQSGTCGIKVWIYRGDILNRQDAAGDRRAADLSFNALGA